MLRWQTSFVFLPPAEEGTPPVCIMRGLHGAVTFFRYGSFFAVDYQIWLSVEGYSNKSDIGSVEYS